MSRAQELLDRVDSDLAGVRSEIDRIEGRREVAVNLLVQSEEQSRDADLSLKARLVLESYTEEEQARLLDRVQRLVSRGLQVIFGLSYGFSIVLGQSRGQVTMEFRITGEAAERDPMASHGGGVVNVVAFVLRLVMVALTPGLSRTMVLDEPFAQLSAGYLEGVGAFLRELADATGIQLIVVSHEPEIAAVADQAWRMTGSGVEKL